MTNIPKVRIIKNYRRNIPLNGTLTGERSPPEEETEESGETQRPHHPQRIGLTQESYNLFFEKNELYQ